MIPILDLVFKWLMAVLLLAVVAGILRSPWFKGKLGERAVKKTLSRHLPPGTYRELSDVTLPSDDGTTQIDHIYVSPFGVFVIETKNMQGWIFGGARQAEWTQTIYRKKSRFQNPLRQNYKHVKTLESLLGLAPDAFKSVVVFAGDCTFKTEMPKEICTRSNVVEHIRSFNERILSDEDVKKVLEKIQAFQLKPTRSVHREHVKSLKRRHSKPAGARP